MVKSARGKAWLLDQVGKSEFFHRKLHEWGVLEVGYQIDQVRGESFSWDIADLEITASAWDKVIHGGIKPVIVFAHPYVLTTVDRAVSYYRMLAMVSLKSMGNVGLNVLRYEQSGVRPRLAKALEISQHLNRIISRLLETDEVLDVREFDLWRGMAVGTQAQGSWQNKKGDLAEEVLANAIRTRVRSTKQVISESRLDYTDVDDTTVDEGHIRLMDGRQFLFSDEPDVALHSDDGTILAAIEVKGGIDKAGVLERVGAAIKSLSRAKVENPDAPTVLILQAVSVTPQAIQDLEAHRNVVNYWFTIEDILDEQTVEEQLFRILGI